MDTTKQRATRTIKTYLGMIEEAPSKFLDGILELAQDAEIISFEQRCKIAQLARTTIQHIDCPDHFVGAETLTCQSCGWNAATNSYNEGAK